MAVKNVECPLCRIPCREWGWAKGVANCPRCRLAFQIAPPTEEMLRSIYCVTYYDSWADRGQDEQYWDLKRSLARHILAEALPLPSGAAVLDVGCATGAFLSVVHDESGKTYGIDINTYAIARARELVPGAVLHEGTIDDCPFEKQSFDVVILSDVLEHVVEPITLLKKVFTFLKPGGIVLMLTPDVSSWSRRLLQGYWPHIKREHVFYFSRTALNQMLIKTGFQDIKMRPLRKPITFGYLARQFRVYPIPIISQLIGQMEKVLPHHIQHLEWRMPMGEVFVRARKAARV